MFEVFKRRIKRPRKLLSALMIAFSVVRLFVSDDSCAEVQTEDSAFTDYETLVAGQFSELKLDQKYRKPLIQEAIAIEFAKQGFIHLIKTAGVPIRKSLGLPPEIDRPSELRLFDALSRSPVWICTEKCPCPSDKQSCAAIKQVSDSQVGIMYLRSGVFASARSPRQKMAAAFKGLRDGLIEIATHRLLATASRSAIEVEFKKVAAVIKELSLKYLSVIDQCPGPYPEDAARFIRSVGGWHDLSSYQNDCITSALKPFEGKMVPKACGPLIDEKLWNTRLKAQILVQPGLVFRCDGFCRMATCGGGFEQSGPATHDSQNVRLMSFGKTWFFDLPENKCDGATPKQPREVGQALLTWIGKRELTGSANLNQLLTQCLDYLYPAPVQ